MILDTPDVRNARTSRWPAIHRWIAGLLEVATGAALLAITVVLQVRMPGFVLDNPAIPAAGIFLMGIGGSFALGYRWSRVLLWPTAIVQLFVFFPVGTIGGAYVLWVLFSTRRRRSHTLRDKVLDTTAPGP